MYEFHARLGEGLFLIYFIIIGVIFFMARSNRTVPGWLTGLSHGLLGLQVALGLILLMEEPDRVVWYHPAIGLAAILALGLTPVFRKRLGHTQGTLAGMAVVAVLALIAMLTVTM
jgi:energy-converting hydrogenase Eha subunit A